MLTSSRFAATARTLRIWLLTNIGGTGWLMLDFGQDAASDVIIPLLMGLAAAVLSLVAVPLAIPFFALAQRQCTGWKCRLIAASVAVLGFFAGNYLVVKLIPIGPFSSLFALSQPYLVAALLAVAWLYRPRPARAAAQVSAA